MDLDKLKGATLDDKTFDALKAHVDELAAQRDAARQESISGRKTLKARADAAEARVAALEDWAGLEAGADLAALPAPKGGQSDAAKQMEAQLKRAMRERDEAVKGRDDLSGRLKGLQRESAIVKALDGHKFKNPADVRVLLESRVVEEGDELLFKTDDGKLVPLKDGAAWFAKTRLDYVEAADGGGQGSGFKGKATGGAKTVTRAELESTPPHQRAALLKEAALVD